MKQLRKFLAVFLSIAMVISVSVPSFADGNWVPNNETTVLLEATTEEESSTAISKVVVEESETTTFFVEEEETSKNLKEEEPEENDTTVDTFEEESTVESEETTIVNAIEEESTTESEETTIVNATEEESTIENEETTMISELEEESVTENEDLFGVNYWCYWYVTDDFSTIHYSSTDFSSISNGHKGRFNDTSLIDYCYTTGNYMTNAAKEQITTVIFDDNIEAVKAGGLFSGFTNLTTIENINYFNTENVTEFDLMFNNCQSLENIDLSLNNMSNGKTFNKMFANCTSLASITLNESIINDVQNTKEMFANCQSLSQINLNHFRTPNLTTTESMFSNCSSLTSIDLENFNTQNVTNAAKMFLGCEVLQTIVFGTECTFASTTNFSQMFKECVELANINVGMFNTENATDFYEMFYKCQSIIALDLSNFNTDNVTRMTNMFWLMTNLVELKLTNFNLQNNTNDFGPYETDYDSIIRCPNLETLNLSNVKMGYLALKIPPSVVNLDITNVDTTMTTRMTKMFSGCSNLTSINTNSFTTENVIDMDSMFSGCSSLTELDLSHFNTANVTSMPYMFLGCTNLQNLNISSFDFRNIPYQNAYISMFYNCPNLTTINMSNVKIGQTRFTGFPESLVNIDISNADTSAAEDLSNMFIRCENITSLNLRSFDTSSVTDMTNMFYNCRNLRKIYVSDLFIVDNVESSGSMFGSCTSIVGENGTTYNFLHTDKEYAHIDAEGNPGYFSITDEPDPEPTPTPTPTLSSISVHTAPNKVNYDVGEMFNPAGLKIRLNYLDGSNTVVTYNNNTRNNFSFNPSLTTALTEVDTYVTITHSGKTCRQNITVLPVKEIASISIVNRPNKVRYYSGNKLNPAGLVIRVYYVDDTTEDISYTTSSAG